MTDTLVQTDVLKGGEFLIRDAQPEDIFIPEELNEEQRMIEQTVKDFLDQDIYPNVQKIEKQQDGIVPRLLNKAADLGFLGAHMPHEYGGLELDTNTNTVIADAMGPAGSFIVAFAAHTGIGMLPILYFGTEDQKRKYL
ncbi:MAG: acyl-CoA dehydrogenase family protein, partial [Thermoanaerobaculia bacterium]|nr:acyl-CoA dehydrogenase family protein [Thermoanaerobaculia bacterium]